jgi:hypothetical protein
MVAIACGDSSNPLPSIDDPTNALPSIDDPTTVPTQTAEPGEDGQSSDPSELSAPSTRSSLPPGPVVTDGVHPTDLTVSCSGDTASLIEIITDAGGEIVEQCSVLNLLRVRFPVASAPELLQVRDSLRSEGLDAVVILVLDPDDLESSAAVGSA